MFFVTYVKKQQIQIILILIFEKQKRFTIFAILPTCQSYRHRQGLVSQDTHRKNRENCEKLNTACYNK